MSTNETRIKMTKRSQCPEERRKAKGVLGRKGEKDVILSLHRNFQTNPFPDSCRWGAFVVPAREITKRSHALGAPVQSSGFKVWKLRNEATFTPSPIRRARGAGTRRKITKRTQSLMLVDFYTYPDGDGRGRPCNFTKRTHSRYSCPFVVQTENLPNEPMRSERRVKVPNF
jgi:hypothetical protein